MFKKMLSAALSLVMILAVCVMPASAVTMTVEDYAYMDIETAPASMRGTILEAREAIIYSESWSVDGNSYVTYPDGTIEVLPKFSDLFPDWDVPTADCEENNTAEIMPRVIFWHGQVFLNAPPANTMSTPFKYVPGTNNYISTKAVSFYGGKVNIGYSIGNTDHTWVNGLSVGLPVTIYGKSGTSYGVRASTYGTPNYATMQIDIG